ncbi:hypothetical protein WA026_000578 [Henosepilachna vigintioctopunctata]
MGIPYAQPPLGQLRFRAPKSAGNWSGVLDARREGSACIEMWLRIVTPTRVVGTEDCLFINIFAKKNPRKYKRLSPVMVYIYGGAFMEGNSDITFYGPELLVSKDVIVVTFNYRIGIFGFLNTGDLASPGNYGLKDQNMALQWIQQNIRNFGGDPDSVTLFGQSAGSVSVHFHMLSPKSKGLFHRAILESGTALCHWGSQRMPRNLAYLVGLANGITKPKDSQDLIERLRQIDSEDLKVTQIGPTFAILGTALRTGLPYSPSIEPDHEDAFISRDYWYDMLKNGDFNQVPVLMGLNANESVFFHRVISLAKPFLIGYDIDPSFQTPPAMNISNHTAAVEVGEIIRQFYLGPNGKFSKADLNDLIEFTNHDYFTRPIHKSASLMAKHIPLYYYYFSYEGILSRDGLPEDSKHKEIRGVGHLEETFYIFNKEGNISKLKTDYLVRERMLKLWTNFAKYGNPTPTREELLNNLLWPTVSPLEGQKMEYLEINETLSLRDSFNEDIYIQWWEDMFRKYAVPPFRNY